MLETSFLPSVQLSEGVNDMLEQRAIAAGVVTREGLRDMIQSVFQEAGVSALVQQSQSPVAAVEPAVDDTPHFVSLGNVTVVSPDYLFPKGPTINAWRVWMCSSVGMPPLRTLKSRNFPSKGLKRKFGNLKFLMEVMEEEIKRVPSNWIETHTLSESLSLYRLASGVLVLDEHSSGGRRRRPGQTEWTTMVNLVRLRNRVIE
jgi:hypothetical protein